MKINFILKCQILCKIKTNNAIILLVASTTYCNALNKSHVYCVLFDVVKAFDGINYCKLFRKPLCIVMSPLVLSLLLVMYIYPYMGQMGKS